MKRETALCLALAGVMKDSKTVNLRHVFHDHKGDGVYEPGCCGGHLLWMKGARDKSPRYTGAFCMDLMHRELGLSQETCKVLYQTTWTDRCPGSVTGAEAAIVLRRAAEGELPRNVYWWAQ